jgi:hypothetical protein
VPCSTMEGSRALLAEAHDGNIALARRVQALEAELALTRDLLGKANEEGKKRDGNVLKVTSRCHRACVMH